jgi:hypothetical protein
MMLVWIRIRLRPVFSNRLDQDPDPKSAKTWIQIRIQPLILNFFFFQGGIANIKKAIKKQRGPPDMELKTLWLSNTLRKRG